MLPTEKEAESLRTLAYAAYVLSQCDHAWSAHSCKHRQKFLKTVSKWKQLVDKDGFSQIDFLASKHMYESPKKLNRCEAMEEVLRLSEGQKLYLKYKDQRADGL